MLERLLDLGLVLHLRRDRIEGAHHVDGAVLDREHHGLLGGQREPAAGRVVAQIVGRRLVGQPFAQVALVDAGRVGELAAGHGALGMQRLVQPERVAHADQGDADGATQIAKDLSDKLVQPTLVDHGRFPTCDSSTECDLRCNSNLCAWQE